LLVAPKLGPQLPPRYRTRDEDENEIEDQDEDEDGGGRDGEVVDRSIYHSGHGDFEGGDEEEASYENPQVEEVPIEEAYYASIRQQYLGLRELVHAEPPSEAVEALSKESSPIVAPFGQKGITFRVWDFRLRNHDPVPAQIALMEKEGVLRLLQVLLGGKFLRRGIELRERTSTWIWSLLARLPEAGELDGSEIAWVRDLGKRAVLLTRSLAEMAALREELATDGRDLGVNDAVDDESDDDEDVTVEMKVDETGDTRVSPSSDYDKLPSPPSSVDPSSQAKNDERDVEEGELEEGEVDEGEIGGAGDGNDNASDGSAPMSEDSLEDAKARLLSGVDGIPSFDENERRNKALQARMNMRATLNMILTVAGEFYGQRDLLEFREPFPSV
jgi:hypothetical protein